jgi:CRP/FNR family transcriptional regulator, cyclic AMP receptor protein
MQNPLFSSIKDKLNARRSKTEVALANIYIFQNLTRRELKLVGSMAHVRHYNSGESVFEQGDPGSGMYIILNGSVGVYQNIPHSEPRRLNDLYKGDFLGELALLDEAPRSASIKTNENSILLGFFRADLMKLLNSKPETGNKIMLALSKVLAHRLRETNDALRLCQLEASKKSEAQ